MVYLDENEKFYKYEFAEVINLLLNYKNFPNKYL